jgi:hypothetical protein
MRAWVIFATNRGRFLASPMADPLQGNDNAFRTSVRFKELIGSHTVTSIAFHAKASGRFQDFG